MFYKGGMVISDQIVHLIIIHRYSTIVALILCHNKIRHYLGIFPKRGGRGSPIPKTGCKNVTQNVIFCENQKCSLWPKMQNKHSIFFCKQDVPKGGVGGGPTIWEKFPKNVVFFDKPPFPFNTAAFQPAILILSHFFHFTFYFL